ncbi:hypothetical protein GH733_008107 [Mirounga leonina]|nr:hypothetical protein GH733_008107 [Mirounga leonina]
MKEIILKRNSMNVKNVVKPSNITVPYKYTKGLTLERNPMNVKNVVKLSVLPILFKNMKELTGERSYECEECGKAFMSHANFRGPVRVHTGDTPGKCAECGRAFCHPRSYRRHENTHWIKTSNGVEKDEVFRPGFSKSDFSIHNGFLCLGISEEEYWAKRHTQLCSSWCSNCSDIHPPPDTINNHLGFSFQLSQKLQHIREPSPDSCNQKLKEEIEAQKLGSSRAVTGPQVGLTPKPHQIVSTSVSTFPRTVQRARGENIIAYILCTLLKVPQEPPQCRPVLASPHADIPPPLKSRRAPEHFRGNHKICAPPTPQPLIMHYLLLQEDLKTAWGI